VPLARLNEIDNFNYTYNKEFDSEWFVQYILKTKKNVLEVKKVLKLDLINKF